MRRKTECTSKCNRVILYYFIHSLSTVPDTTELNNSDEPFPLILRAGIVRPKAVTGNRALKYATSRLIETKKNNQIATSKAQRASHNAFLTSQSLRFYLLPNTSCEVGNDFLSKYLCWLYRIFAKKLHNKHRTTKINMLLYRFTTLVRSAGNA